MNEAKAMLQELAEKVRSGKAVLFLGAGCSVAAGGPTTSELVSEIKEKFGKIDQSLNILLDVCHMVIESRHYGRPVLEEYIREKLSRLQPSKAHMKLPNHDWAAIYTTNFDDLIELAFRTKTAAERRCVVVDTPNFSPISFADKSKLFIFKLMGNVNGWKEEDRMALSRTDYRRRIRESPEYIKNLKDFVKKDGTIIFIGYSGDDDLAFDMIDEAIQLAGGVQNIMPSYALYPKVKTDLDWLYKFQKRKINPVECAFEDFMEYLETKKPVAKPERFDKETIHLRLRGCDLKLPQNELLEYLKYFKILNEEELQTLSGEKDDFFKGSNRRISAFGERWDFIRDVYSNSNGLKERALSELSKRNPHDNCALLVTGIPGIGKSIALLRLAFDLYQEGYAVMIFDSSRSSLDFKMLDSFILKVNRHLFEQTRGEIRSAKPVVIFDDASSLLFDPTTIADYLSSRSRSALVIAAARETSWKAWTKELPIQVPEKNVFTIDQSLNISEKERIVDHLSQLGYIAGGTTWDYIIDRQFKNSFFATMYSLVDPARRPLNNIIREQYLKLNEDEKNLFCVVSSFHRFNLPVNIELLVRSLEISYQRFYEIVEAGKLREIVIETQDLPGNLLYSTHNQIIAEKTFDFFFSDPTRQKEVYSKILSKVHFSNEKEHDIVNKLMVFYLGPNSSATDLSLSQKRELFKTLCQSVCTKSILHHWGILEMDDRNYSEAERLFKKALASRVMFPESFRGERKQNILTSLGMLYARWGNQEEDNPEMSKILYIKAERCFKEARISLYPAPHPYHAEASMYLKRGDICVDNVQRLEYYAQALAITEIARDHLNPTDLAKFSELEIMINARLRNEAAIESAMKELAEKHGSARGFYLYSVILSNRAKRTPQNRRRILQKSLEVVKIGIRRFPDDELCLMQKARLLKRMYPTIPSKYFPALEQWFHAAETPTVWLLYELAAAAFQLGYYETAYSRFGDLEKVSSGNTGRFRFRYYLMDEKGNRRTLEGTVSSIHSPYEGKLRCETLRELKRYIRFRPMTCDFNPQVGDQVSFNIGFNYVSPEATKVTSLVTHLRSPKNS